MEMHSFDFLDPNKILQDFEKITPAKDSVGGYVLELYDNLIDAIECEDENRFKEVKAEFLTFYFLESKLPDLLSCLIYLKKSQLDRCFVFIEGLYSEGIVEKSELVIYHFLKGCCYFYSSDVKDAILEFDRSISLHKTFYEAYLFRGLSKAIILDHKSAVKDFRKALKGDFQLNEIEVNLAYSYYHSESILRAFYLYRKQVNRFENHWKVTYNMALCYRRFKMHKKALYWLNKTEESSSEFTGIYLTRGYVNIKLGKSSDAIKDLKKAKEMGEERKVNQILRFTGFRL